MNRFCDIIQFENQSSPIVVAGAADPLVIELLTRTADKNIPFMLVGEKKAILTQFKSKKINMNACTLHEPPIIDEQNICQMAACLCRDTPSAILMKGQVHTAEFVRSILKQENGLIQPESILSHIALFSNPLPQTSRHTFLLTDAAINVTPDINRKKKILANAIHTARTIDIPTPRIALLAPVETSSPRITSTTDALELKQWLQTSPLGPAIADGPLALDAAASTAAAAAKGISSPVTSKVDIYLAPNLDSGNILYKALSVFAKAKVAAILSGAKVPVVLTSRSDSPQTRLASLALALRTSAGAVRSG